MVFFSPGGGRGSFWFSHSLTHSLPLPSLDRTKRRLRAHRTTRPRDAPDGFRVSQGLEGFPVVDRDGHSRPRGRPPRAELGARLRRLRRVEPPPGKTPPRDGRHARPRLSPRGPREAPQADDRTQRLRLRGVQRVTPPAEVRQLRRRRAPPPSDETADAPLPRAAPRWRAPRPQGSSTSSSSASRTPPV